MDHSCYWASSTTTAVLVSSDNAQWLILSLMIFNENWTLDPIWAQRGTFWPAQQIKIATPTMFENSYKKSQFTLQVLMGLFC